MAIFLETMRNQTHRRVGTGLLRKLNILRHGGSWGGDVHTGGIYSLLCDIESAGPYRTTGLDSSIVPDNMRNPTRTADRDDRDYRVLHNMDRLVGMLKSDLDSRYP